MGLTVKGIPWLRYGDKIYKDIDFCFGRFPCPCVYDTQRLSRDTIAIATPQPSIYTEFIFKSVVKPVRKLH